MTAKKKMKVAKEYSWIPEGTHRSKTVYIGDIVEGDILKHILENHADYLVEVDEEIEEVVEEGRYKDLRLTEPEKPAKPKDEDPDDPDKKKK